MKDNYIKLFLLLSYVVLTTNVYAQKSDALVIGDKFHDFEVPNLIHDPNSRFSTADFKDKLLIIDFWATSCSGCVAALPHMAELQKVFGDRIKILPVTYEKKDLVTSFWSKNKYTRNLDFPTVVEDQQFSRYFPHEALPHEVWIYKGKVIGITESEYVDHFNITQVLNGEIPDWPVKNDYYAFDGSKQSLFNVDENQVDPTSTSITYEAARGYMEKNGANAAGFLGNAGIVRDTVKKTIRTYFVNQAIFSAYVMNWNKLIKIESLVKPSTTYAPNQIIWEVDNPTRYMYKSYATPNFKTGYTGDWMRKNAICFEAVYEDKGQNDQDIARNTIAAMNRLFRLSVGWEKRKEKVWVLRKTKRSFSKKVNVETDEINISLTALISSLNEQADRPYVFDETGIKGGMTLSLRKDSGTDFEYIRKVLSKYGLEFKEELRLVDKFIFRAIK